MPTSVPIYDVANGGTSNADFNAILKTSLRTGDFDIIDNEITGYLVDKNSSEQIVDKILHVSKNRQIIRDIVFSAREKYIRKYTLEVFEENLFFILKTILKK